MPGLSARLKRLARPVGAGSLNQLVASGTQFAYSVYLARTLEPAEFGRFGLGFGLCMLFSSVGNAVVLSQMAVCMADRAPGERAGYGARMLVGTLGLSAALLAPAAVAGAAAGALHVAQPGTTRLGAAIALVSVAFLLKEFLVRYAYAVQREWWGLRLNAAAAVVLPVALLAWTALLERPIDATAALALLGLAYLAAVLSGLAIARLPLRAAAGPRLAADLLEAWQGGRWALAGATCAWAQSQAYLFVTASLLGAAAAGAANAARLFVAPLTVFAGAMYQIALPRLAALRSSDPAAMLRHGRAIGLALGAIGLVYAAIVVVVAPAHASSVVGARYGDLAPLIGAWALVVLLMIARDAASVLHQAGRQFRPLTIAVAGTAVVSLAAVSLLAGPFGAVGSVLGTAIGEALLAAVLWWRMTRARA